MSSVILEEIVDNRCDAVTSLRQSQLVMLRILRVVDKICRENNITYWLDGGTLLGAVRHEGFIPWDDDVDIAVLRKDYNKLIAILKTKLPDDFFLQTNETDIEYDMSWLKIRDRSSRIVEYKVGNYHSGIFIDIFPCDEFNANDKTILIYKKAYKVVHRLLLLIKEPFERINTPKMAIKTVVKLLSKIILLPFYFMPKKSLFKKLDSLKHRYISRLTKENSNKIGYGVEVMFWNFFVSRDVIFPVGEIEFEGYKFLCPNSYDGYLKAQFGNYMELPPEKDRIPHNIEIKPIITEEEKEKINRNFGRDKYE